MRSLSTIAQEIRANWTKPYFGAVPYLDAMATMGNISENYGMDSGVSVVLYFLANANTWRGEVARRVKKELSGMAKGKRGTLRRYIVTYLESGISLLLAEGALNEQYFACSAEDIEHAKEQCLNAYPGCHIVLVSRAIPGQ